MKFFVAPIMLFQQGAWGSVGSWLKSPQYLEYIPTGLFTASLDPGGGRCPPSFQNQKNFYTPLSSLISQGRVSTTPPLRDHPFCPFRKGSGRPPLLSYPLRFAGINRFASCASQPKNVLTLCACRGVSTISILFQMGLRFLGI